MKTLKFTMILLLSLLTLNSCKSIKEPIITQKQPLTDYKYIYVPTCGTVSSETGVVTGGGYGVVGGSVGKSINPCDAISGILIKQGFIKIHEIKPELASETLIVNYGESERGNEGILGYTMEITIQFISAQTNQVVCTCISKGRGETETDGIKKAIYRGLDNLFHNK